MKLYTLSILLGIAYGVFPAAPGIETRNPSEPFHLVAYGVAPSYINIFYSDGRAYAGDSSLWPHGSVTTDIAFTINNTQLITTSTNPAIPLDTSTLLYIRPTRNKVLAVGFTGAHHPLPEDAVTDDFLFYGNYLMWAMVDGELSDSFRLKKTNVSGVYQVYWDQSNLFLKGYFLPVVRSG